MRGWSHGTHKQVFPGGPRAGGPDGLAVVTLPSGNTLGFNPQITSEIPEPAVGNAVALSDFPTGPANAGSFAPSVNLASTTETYAGTGVFSLVPEPASLTPLGISTAGLAIAARRRREAHRSSL